MITSGAPGPVLDKLRRLSGPNPTGSKLTDGERLHLILLIAQLDEYGRNMQVMAETVIKMRIKDALTERGLTTNDIAAAFREHGDGGAVTVADAIAVHPSLRDPYLD